MPKLEPKDFPDFKESTIAAINKLSDEQLRVEVEKNGNSRFGVKKQPLLIAALAQRQRESRKTNGDLQPQPPELFKKILWIKEYGFRHRYISLAALLVTLAPFTYNLYQSSTKEETNNPALITENSSQVEVRKDKKTSLSAPNIRFSDGAIDLS